MPSIRNVGHSRSMKAAAMNIVPSDVRGATALAAKAAA
jgi:hypothetical protein